MSDTDTVVENEGDFKVNLDRTYFVDKEYVKDIISGKKNDLLLDVRDMDEW